MDYFVFTNLAAVQAFKQAVDAAMGLPKPGSETFAEFFKHFTQDLWAYPKYPAINGLIANNQIADPTQAAEPDTATVQALHVETTPEWYPPDV